MTAEEAEPGRGGRRASKEPEVTVPQTVLGSHWATEQRQETKPARWDLDHPSVLGIREKRPVPTPDNSEEDATPGAASGQQCRPARKGGYLKHLC